jgi:hypothetical protein
VPLTESAMRCLGNSASCDCVIWCSSPQHWNVRLRLWQARVNLEGMVLS